MTATAHDISFRGLFRNRDFAVLFTTGTQSQLGDQLARVALAVLVYASTHSGLATASTYALTYLPAVIGGVLLTGLADTRPRRGLLVTCDLLRAALFTVMAMPGLPLGVVCALLVLAVLIGSPYNAAEPAIVADIFEGPVYQTAIGLRTATLQAAQLVGFATGGIVVAITGAHMALLIDAATFAVSAVFLRLLLSEFTPPAPTSSGLQQLRTGMRAVLGDPRLRGLLGFAWLTAMWVVPEGLAAPYVAAQGGGPSSVGILMAAGPTGNLIGTLIVTRWVPPDARSRILGALAVLAGVPLILCAGGPPIWVAVVLLGATGVLTSYLVVVITEFVAITPSGVRGQAIGLASSSLLAAQGVGLLLGGAVDALWGASAAIAVAGAVGAGCALPLALARRRRRVVSPRGAHRANTPRTSAS